jgi:hypothetical protein
MLAATYTRCSVLQAVEQQLGSSQGLRGQVRELEQGTQALRQQVLQAQAQHKQAVDQLGALGESSHQVLWQQPYCTKLASSLPHLAYHTHIPH